MTRLRCAIYTRKSSDEGLEQEFNSLDAQRDACRSYIDSQRHEGWSLIRTHYDDGGYSGGTMDRPGLKALLADIDAGKVDIVVIYKIDRLTRSLADFARIMERFEKAGISFVSVTQSFNTKTSMGRLMLHVLLSFAQFEREVGAERVRDKIAASRAKGIWMGGMIPLGYDVQDRKLIVIDEEAATVRAIFASFARLQSVPATLDWAREQGLVTKIRVKNGEQKGGHAITYGSLRCLLSNRLYAGQMEHKGNIYEGQQDAIVDRDLFEQVQAILATRCSEAMRGPKMPSDSLLQGLIADHHDRRMGPAHTRRNGARYRYYVTHPKTITKDGPSPLRLSAEAIERHCIDLLAEHWMASASSIDEAEQIQRRVSLIRHGDTPSKRTLFLHHVLKVVVGEGSLTITLNDGTRLDKSIDRIRHGNDASLIIGDARQQDGPVPNAQLVKLMQDAYRARALALAKPMTALPKLAQQFGRSTERYKRLIRLSHLSPRIVEAIIAGQQPATMTGRQLQNLDGIPHRWTEQESLLLG